MEIKNKRLISLLLSFTTIFSFGGCAKQSISSDEKESSSLILKAPEFNINDNVNISPKVEVFYVDDENICVTTNVNLREKPNESSNVITKVDEYEKVKRIETNNDWDYVSYNGKEGYVSKKYTEELGDTFVEVDISEQKLYLYVDDELYLTADVVTGKKDTYDTRLGCNPIYSKETNRYLNGDDYSVYVNFWLPFDGGQGLHDASWRNSFDKDDYLNGSHGCVNLKYADAKKIYENVSVGTKVLVHK